MPDDFRNLRSFILDFVYIPAEISKTAQFVRQTIIDRVTSAGLSQNFYVITDEATNMLAFDMHMVCSCHLLSTATKRTTDLYEDSGLPTNAKDTCGLVLNAIWALRVHIAACRRITLVLESLGSCLRMPVETRWGSACDMVHTYMHSEAHILTRLQELKTACESQQTKRSIGQLITEHERLMRDFRPHYEAYITVVKPIVDHIPTLEGQKTVTSPYILPVFSELICRANALKTSNNPYESSLARAAEEVLAKKFTALNRRVMFVAAFLEPEIYVQLDSICAGIQSCSLTSVMFSLQEIITAVQTAAHGLTPANTQSVTPSQSSRFSYFAAKPIINTLDTELKRYDLLATEPANHADFWKKHGTSMPMLNRVAKRFHSIPASSAPSERAFSQLNLTATDKRNRLNPETICHLLMYQSLINADHGPEDESLEVSETTED